MQYTQEKLNKILENHKHWLNEDCEGWENMRADLRNADLRNANLRNADLWNANLWNVNLGNANLWSAKNIRVCITCPDEGSFIAWKKCNDNLIVKLEIPADAERSSATTRKCRASKALVLDIQNLDGTKADTETAISSSGMEYKIGETVYPDGFDKNRWNECSNGIHFFINRIEAEDW